MDYLKPSTMPDHIALPTAYPTKHQDSTLLIIVIFLIFHLDLPLDFVNYLETLNPFASSINSLISIHVDLKIK